MSDTKQRSRIHPKSPEAYLSDRYTSEPQRHRLKAKAFLQLQQSRFYMTCVAISVSVTIRASDGQYCFRRSFFLCNHDDS